MKLQQPTIKVSKRKTRDQRAISHYENGVKLALQQLLTLLNPEDSITWSLFNYKEIVPYAHDFLTSELRAVQSPESAELAAEAPAPTALEL